MAKTLKQIEARLQAYKKGTVDSPYRVKTPTSYDPSLMCTPKVGLKI